MAAMASFWLQSFGWRARSILFRSVIAMRLCRTAHAIFFPKFWKDKMNFTRVFVTVSPRRPWDQGWPKTWRISASADAIWFLRLQVFTTDQPRCYAFDKVLLRLVFTEKLWLFCFRDKSSRKNSFFRLLTQEPVKIVRKCFF